MISRMACPFHMMEHWWNTVVNTLDTPVTRRTARNRGRTVTFDARHEPPGVWQAETMSWLVYGEQVLASVEVMDTRRTRRRGLLGRTSLDGAVVLVPARSVHTVGMKFPIDVVFCRRTVDADAERPGERNGLRHVEVLDIVTMAENRIGRPRLRSHAIIEMPAGACSRLGIEVGDALEFRRGVDGGQDAQQESAP